MTMHAVRCKKTGEALGMKLDGGSCACPSADECREHPRAETLSEFLDRAVTGEESRREVAKKFEETFRDVIVTMTKARDMLMDVMEQRDKAEARFRSLLLIGPVATERERCAKICDEVEADEMTLNAKEAAAAAADKIRRGGHAGDGT